MSEFHGFDWVELAEHWGIDMTQDEDVIYIRTEHIIEKGMIESWDNKQSQIATDVRNFLERLSEYGSYEQPIWKGLLEVEHDWTFLSFAKLLLRNMWC